MEISRDTSIADSIDSLEISDKEMEEESSVCIEEVEEAVVEEEHSSPVEEPPNEEQTVKKLKPICKLELQLLLQELSSFLWKLHKNYLKIIIVYT